jgi:hypothetical protein
MDAANVTAHTDAEANIYSLLNVSINILYYASYPFQKLLLVLYLVLITLLRPIWSAISFLLLPVVYIASAFSYAITLPFRFLAKLEVRYDPTWEALSYFRSLLCISGLPLCLRAN